MGGGDEEAKTIFWSTGGTDSVSEGIVAAPEPPLWPLGLFDG